MRGRDATTAPEGFRYRADFLTPDEERELVEHVAALPFHEVRMHGVVARRTVIHFGYDYDYSGWKITPTDAPPPFLRFVIERAAAEAGVAAERLAQFLIARYPPGASIGWHRDAPMFGVPVIGVSLLGACRMRFRRKQGNGWESFEQRLEPRSLYILDGAARTQWQHHIPPAKELRYSISMRTLRRMQQVGKSDA
ncbi:MAG TPA: alpha-ketoglutarate-dependent dioxygenase AlkB [Thermoanaerobaculia bacterium]|nr:alpha-ketoglutarate-dependent dioxygenase AlkB [Thermoanaerobaculia bacterium]